jgi:hypothetical protein
MKIQYRGKEHSQWQNWITWNPESGYTEPTFPNLFAAAEEINHADLGDYVYRVIVPAEVNNPDTFYIDAYIEIKQSGKVYFSSREEIRNRLGGSIK